MKEISEVQISLILSQPGVVVEEEVDLVDTQYCQGRCPGVSDQMR